ncbi:Long-chain-fatty-acid--CoA ligase [Serinicoccus hydrothermalis]|uniref:Long-chain-fatty-acid--CoA ligase n=1 Tax=Serinicoccus hydrothermalis TaxID=1758689 RepID=A0A1B1N9S4_9MICO|nr:Long-chain-fatty-acid--CoA ligase [Serinicoccus hydrothermalis]
MLSAASQPPRAAPRATWPRRAVNTPSLLMRIAIHKTFPSACRCAILGTVRGSDARKVTFDDEHPDAGSRLVVPQPLDGARGDPCRADPGRPRAGRTTTWSQLADRSFALAGALRERGVGPGDRVALLTLNHPQFVEAVVAVNALGAMAVPLNFRLAPPELAYILQDSAPRAILVDGPLAPALAAVHELPDSLEVRICVGPAPGGGGRRPGAGGLRAGGRGGGADRPAGRAGGDDRAAHVHLRHDGTTQGGDAEPPQHAGAGAHLHPGHEHGRRVRRRLPHRALLPHRRPRLDRGEPHAGRHHGHPPAGCLRPRGGARRLRAGGRDDRLQRAAAVAAAVRPTPGSPSGTCGCGSSAGVPPLPATPCCAPWGRPSRTRSTWPSSGRPRPRPSPACSGGRTRCASWAPWGGPSRPSSTASSTRT